MGKKAFFGIDFSKETFDVTLVENLEQKSCVHSTFSNDKSGFEDLLKWCKKSTKISKENWLFCGEHTGLYSHDLPIFLTKKELFVWLENPLQITASSGIQRGKNDKIDSQKIAIYACRYQDKAVKYEVPEKAIEDLKLLLGFRERLVKEKVAMEVSAKETRRVLKLDPVARFIYDSSMQEVERIKKKIKDIEQKITVIIDESELKNNYSLLISIKGVGMITAVNMIIYTNNFKNFVNARQLASYCGCAPFGKSSGTSVNVKAHVSHLANKKLKVLLSQCAGCAIMWNQEIRVYYNRKIAQGKQKKVIINNIRNKLIHRIFAVVTQKVPYNPCYINNLAV